MELTEDQKFMICEAAGVPMVVVQHEDGSLHKRTARPCGIEWDGCKFIVYVGAAA